MHLAIVTPYPPRVIGIGQYGYHVSQALVETGAFDRITLLTERAPGAPHRDRRSCLAIERIWQHDSIEAGLRIVTRLRTLDPDVVWYNLGASVFGRSPQANLSGLLSPLFTHQLEIPSVVTMHEAIERVDFEALGLSNGPITMLGAKLITFLMLQADVTCVTLGCHADWLGPRHPDQRLMHIPHSAFDLPRMLPSSNRFELLHFGSQAPFKGLDLLLRAFPDLHAEWPELQLTVAGAEHPRFPGYQAALRREFGHHPAIRWQGFVPTPELAELFGRATIVVLPYLATTGSSSVLCRAATWGRPVVASDLAEMEAIAQESGFRVTFFRSGDGDDLTRALRRLLTNPDLRADQARHNLDAIDETRLEKACWSYIRAFNLALASQAVESRIPLTAVEEAT